MAQRKVLVTGATGYVAGLILPALRERYDLTLIDVRAARGDGTPVEGTQRVNLLDDDWETLRPYFAGQDSVVHLAFNRDADAAMSGARRATRLTPGSSYEAERGNVDMAYRVLQLALEEQIRRVVIASSNHAADWYERLIHAGQMDVVTPETYPKSDNFYGWAKATYEQLGFVYASGTLGAPVQNIHLRIGAPREIVAASFADDPKGYKRDLGAYISARDLAQLVIKSIETEEIRDAHGIPWQVFYGISNNTRAFWSNVAARHVIGYAPEDDSEVTFAADIARFIATHPGRT